MKVSKELVKGSTVILILSLLESKSMYGYEMIKAIEEKSAGTFSFKEGTLYPILHALEADGLVEAYWEQAAGTRKRKYYRITAKGRAQAQAKKEEWVMFKTAVDRVLGGKLIWN
ncbi:MAG: PadR family transcriptional regulator [Firmicutes bacterium]|nr:PadR family transcriptional regulator [Bacillota bacterium]